MLFTKRLRQGIVQGRITCTVRIWQWPHVKLHGRYRLGRGYVEVDAIRQIAPSDINDKLGRRCGFGSAQELLKVAKHGRGQIVYLIDFHYVEGKRPETRIGVRTVRRTNQRVKRLL